jgi:hypothetical protein
MLLHSALVYIGYAGEPIRHRDAVYSDKGTNHSNHASEFRPPSFPFRLCVNGQTAYLSIIAGSRGLGSSHLPSIVMLVFDVNSGNYVGLRRHITSVPDDQIENCRQDRCGDGWQPQTEVSDVTVHFHFECSAVSFLSRAAVCKDEAKLRKMKFENLALSENPSAWAM